MDSPHVGVLTEDPTLVVALGLRGTGMQVQEVHAPEELATCDLALVDLPHARDLEVLLARTGDVPTVVMLSASLPVPPGVTVVRRPCSVEQVMTALQAARDGVDLEEATTTIVLDEPVAVAGATDPLFARHEPPAVRAGWSSQPDPVPTPVTERLQPPSPTTPLEARLARQLRDAAGPDQQLGASTVVTASLAERLAEAIQVQHRADHVCLWTRHGDDHVVLGVVGGGSAAHDIRLRGDHPVLVQARQTSGRFLRGPDEEPPHAPGLPGSWSMTYGVVELRDVPGPVDVVTISGPAVTPATLEEVRGLFA